LQRPIGGLATLIGTPPNALFAAFMKENYDLEISFFDWMLVGVPLTAILLPTAWLVLTRLVFPVDIQENSAAGEHLRHEREALGRITYSRETGRYYIWAGHFRLDSAPTSEFRIICRWSLRHSHSAWRSPSSVLHAKWRLEAKAVDGMVRS
jgi:hypothetical protein